MTQQNALRRRISGRFSQKVDNQSIVTGTIGDGAGNIETGTPNKIFCQVGDQVIQAWANDVPKVYGLSVYIVNSTRYPGELEIIAGNARYNTIFSGYNNNVAEHGIEHSWLGRDPVWVQLRQFMPLWIGAAGNPAAPYTIRIGRGLVWTAGGLAEVQNQVVNLEDFLPISGAGGERYCRYALITIGSAGEIVSTAGTSVAEADFGLDDIPAAPAGTLMVLGAVRLYSDQESIVEARDRTDIIDLRYPYRHTHTAAEAGGHDAVTVADTATVDLSLTGQQISADVIPSGIDAADLGSGAATDGQVLTADGAGGAAWEVPTGGGSALTVKESDGTPSAANVNTIQVTNGTMTDEGNGVVTLDFGSAATDGSAIHDNVAGEIHAITEKTNLVDNDELIIEDSADSYNKKRVKKSAIGGNNVLGYCSSTSDSVVNPDPTSDIDVDSMSIAFSLAATKIVMILFRILKYGAHPDRFAIYDGTTQILPVNGLNSGYYDHVAEESGEYSITHMCYVSLASGSHTIKVKHQAAKATGSITFKERWMVCQIIG